MSAASRRVGLGRLALALFFVLLGLSHLVRYVRSTRPPAPVEPAADVRVVEHGRRLEREIPLAYRELGPREAEPISVVVLLHGSPGSGGDFAGVAPLLAERRRVIVPDLPGFGRTSAVVPDYSIRAHADYVLQLMDRLRVERAHLVGFSMGGGVALSLYDLAPERVLSTTLVSAIGVQELELFGDYRLNHLVHGAQLAGLWLMREVLPHMGYLDGAFFGVPYARNFYDSDQRPLREILTSFAPPMLILHGRDDFLVLPEVAVEHHRLVPQSELAMLDGSHFMIFMEPRRIAGPLADFVDAVDAGLRPVRSATPAARRDAARAPFDASRIPPLTGVALIVMLALIATATLISEDLTCVWVGLMVAQGRLDFAAGALACFAGIYVGDLLIFLSGRWLGRPALDRWPLTWLVRARQVEISSRWFARRGPIVIGLSRFLPGTRFPTYFAAGMLRTSFWSFSLYFFVAVALWTPLLVGLSAVLGEQALVYVERFRRFAVPAAILLVLWILLVIRLLTALMTFGGRRRLVGRWRRLTRWEFWPPWVFYPPVLLYVAYLGVRHRSPLLFTAANPAMPAGGFVAESKGAILEGLAAAGPFVARSLLVPAGEAAETRAERVHEFMSREELDYPIVLKPDAGQRGSGVAVVRDDAALLTYFGETRFDVLAQEHAPGREFGVFYYRHPRLEELILRDPRAVCMADHYLKVQAGRESRVPEPGEVVPLVELGTHCRGAIFLDGSWLRTEALESAIDRISSAYDGFFFGRYDLRAPDTEELKQGRGFKILELNGVTSEATHIYDPAIDLLAAYSVLFRQWRIAFEIGAENRARGVEPAGTRELLRLIADYRRTSRSHPG
jgi:pimeloyl-ACP methyl ester carboxylesterase/membrane protein DedA with SNARE-associated domain